MQSTVQRQCAARESMRRLCRMSCPRVRVSSLTPTLPQIHLHHGTQDPMWWLRSNCWQQRLEYVSHLVGQGRTPRSCCADDQRQTPDEPPRVVAARSRISSGQASKFALGSHCDLLWTNFPPFYGQTSRPPLGIQKMMFLLGGLPEITLPRCRWSLPG